jgi:hypothetical protein
VDWATLTRRRIRVSRLAYGLLVLVVSLLMVVRARIQLRVLDKLAT